MAEPQGRLHVFGTLDTAQFWTSGSSDADTVKVTLRQNPSPVEFTPRPGAATMATQVLQGARVQGGAGRKPVLDKQNRIDVRLEGIDGPELHYPLPAEIDKHHRTAQQEALWAPIRDLGDTPWEEGPTAAGSARPTSTSCDAVPTASISRTPTDCRMPRSSSPA